MMADVTGPNWLMPLVQIANMISGLAFQIRSQPNGWSSSYDRLGIPPEDEWHNIMRAMNDLLAGLPVQAGLAILADLIADGIRPMPPEERARALAIINQGGA
jgi:hypothetical protein